MADSALLAEFLLEIDDHLGQHILKNLMTILLDRTVRKMRPCHEIAAILQNLDVTNGLHRYPMPKWFYPAIPPLYI